MTLPDIITMSYDEGLFGKYYSIDDAKVDKEKNLLASHNHRHIIRQSPHCKHCTMRKLPPHIEIEFNAPHPGCKLHDEQGFYLMADGKKFPCICRDLWRQPTQEEINSEVEASL